MKLVNLCLLCITLAGVIVMPVSHAGPPQIIVTIKPLHSLVAAVSEGVNKPGLLLDGISSPHLYTLKPSAIRSVHKADLVVWAGEGLESFLIGTLRGVPDQHKVLKLNGIQGLTLLPLREKGFHHHDHAPPQSLQRGVDDDHHDESAQHRDAGDDPHQHGRDHGDHASGTAFDMHFWLSPDNAAVVVGAIAEKLVELDPDNAAVYTDNALNTQRKLKQLSIEVEQLLADSDDLPYLVFHDSFQYFEHRFNLASAGVISVQPDAQPGAQTIRQLQSAIASGKVRCLFSEPQFTSRSINMLVRNSDINHAVIDPLGAGFDAGPDMYFEWMTETAKTFRECFDR